jgi:hypothetical protein
MTTVTRAGVDIHSPEQEGSDMSLIRPTIWKWVISKNKAALTFSMGELE